MESRRVTTTLEDQWMVERQVREIYDYFYSIPPNSQSVIIELERDEHFDYLSRGLRILGPSFSVLDANRPWLCYWILHSIALLGESIDGNLENDAIDFLSRCQMKANWQMIMFLKIASHNKLLEEMLITCFTTINLE